MDAGHIRLGVIGAGYVAEAYHLPVLKNLPQVSVEWLCDQNLKRAKELARMTGVSGAFERLEDCPNVDVVLVTVPPGARRAVMHEVFRRGWHAFCEKPFAADLDEHQWIIGEARHRNLRLAIGLVRRYYASTRTAQRLVESRLLGPVRDIVAGEGQRVQKTGRGAGWYQADPRASGGGVLAETGTHLIDQVLSICSARRFAVRAVEQQRVAGLEFDTLSRVLLELGPSESVPFSFRVTRLEDIYNGIVIRCENGELRLALAPDSPVELWDRHGRLASRVPAPIPGLAALSAAVKDEWESFLRALVISPSFDDEDTGLASASLIDACYRVGASVELQAPKTPALGVVA